MFTAYVVKCVEGKRQKYLAKKNYRVSVENYLEDDSEYEPISYFDEDYAIKEKERLLNDEIRGCYPSWDELSSLSLVYAIKMLQKKEQEILFQHIFEEKTFKQISAETGEAANKIENRYYYALKKLRKWIGEKNL